MQATSEQLAVAIANAHLHQTVKASEAEYRSLVENIPKVIFRLDLAGPLRLRQPGRADHARMADETVVTLPACEISSGTRTIGPRPP